MRVRRRGPSRPGPRRPPPAARRPVPVGLTTRPAPSRSGDHYSHLRLTGVWKQNDLRSCLVGLTFCSCSPVSGQRSIAANVRRVLEDAAAHGSVSVADAGGNATAWRAGEAPPPIVAIGGGGEEMPRRRCEAFKFCRSKG